MRGELVLASVVSKHIYSKSHERYCGGTKIKQEKQFGI